MMDVVTRHNAHLYQQSLRQAFRIRHRVFVDGLGWEAIRRPDGLERDQFDNLSAIYLLMFNGDGDVVGHQRLLETTGPHLFSDVFPHTCEATGVIRGPRILEAGRTCLDVDIIPRAQIRSHRRMLMLGLWEFLVRAGVPYITGLTGVDLVHCWIKRGIEVKPLGLPIECEGRPYLAVRITVTAEMLAREYAEMGITSPQLQYLAPQAVQPSIFEWASEASSTPVH